MRPQALTVVMVAWGVLGGRAGLSATESVGAVTTGGVVCLAAVWMASRSLGVRCGRGAWAVALLTAAVGGLATMLQVSGLVMMGLLVVPGSLGWVVCWPGSLRARLGRLLRFVVAVPVAGMAWASLFILPTTPALLGLAVICLALDHTAEFLRWLSVSALRVVVAAVAGLLVAGVLTYAIDHRLSFGTGVAMAEVGAWLAAALVLVLITAWPYLSRTAAAELVSGPPSATSSSFAERAD